MRQLVSKQFIDVPVPEIYKGCILIRTEYACLPGETRSMHHVQTTQSIALRILQNPKSLMMGWFKYLTSRGLKNTFRRIRARPAEQWIKHVPTHASIAGIVDDVAQNVSEFSPGDRVAAAILNAPLFSDFYAVPVLFCKKLTRQMEYRNAAALLYASMAAYVRKQLRKEGISSVKIFGHNLAALTINQVLVRSGLHVLTVKNLTVGEDDRNKKKVVLVCGTEWLNYVENISRGYQVWLIAVDEYYIPHDLANSPNLRIIGFPNPDTSNLDPYSDLVLEAPTWLSQENLAEGMSMISNGVINLSTLIDRDINVTSYEQNSNLKSPTLLVNIKTPSKARMINLKTNNEAVRSKFLNISVIGGGAFARATIIPLVTMQKGVFLRGVADWNPFIARHTAARFGFEYCSTEGKTIIEDTKTDAVFIVTYHDSHAHLAASALQAGKAVFVEKPLALDFSQLKVFADTYRKYGGFIAVGYNRRYAPATKLALKYINEEAGPTTVVCSMRVWEIPPTSYYYWPKEGTRIASNTCHWLDLIYVLVGRKKPVSIGALPSLKGRKDENYSITVNFEDGSIGVIIFSNRGKFEGHEWIDIKRGRTSIFIDNFREIKVRRNERIVKHRNVFPQKGHAQEIKTIIEKIKTTEPSPTSFEDIIMVSFMIFYAREALFSGKQVLIESFYPIRDSTMNCNQAKRKQ